MSLSIYSNLHMSENIQLDCNLKQFNIISVLVRSPTDVVIVRTKFNTRICSNWATRLVFYGL